MGDVESIATNADINGDVVEETREKGPQPAEVPAIGESEAASARVVAPVEELHMGEAGGVAMNVGPNAKGAGETMENRPEPTEVLAGGGLEATSAPVVSPCDG